MTVQLTIEQAFQQAVEHHRAGRLPNAEGLYRAVLNAQPAHPDANHNLGVLAMQVKNVAAALPYLKTALEANPAQGQYWLSYIEALIDAGRRSDAQTVLAQGRSRGLNGAAVDVIALRLHKSEYVETQCPDSLVSSSADTAPVKEAPEQQKGKQQVCGTPGKSSRVSSTLNHQASTGEINELMSLFSAARYEEASAVARKMTERFPRHPLAWKVLGSALQRMGRNTGALLPMSKSAELSPADAEAHCNLGIILKDLGRLNEAEAYCRRALKTRPRFADAHTCLGTILNDLGRKKEAEASFRRALKIAPRQLGAHMYLGSLLHEAGRLSEAEEFCRRTIAINPASAKSHNNLGITLKDLGRLEEASASFQHALALNPDFAAAQFNLAETYCYVDDLDQAARAYQRVFELTPHGVGMDALVYLSILCYLQDDLDQCEANLSKTREAMALPDAMHKNARIYGVYLTKLVSWHQRRNVQNPCMRGEAVLYVVGESHALSPHGMSVHLHGDEQAQVVCKAEWILGCKQWHLGNAKANAYKRKFEALMARLPRGATILTMIGEIDCRLNEGIIAASRKPNAKDLLSIVEETAGSYIDYLVKVAGLTEKRIIVAGVPATNIAKSTSTEVELEEQAFVIKAVNTTLKNRAAGAGIGFLDLFTLTDRGNGTADGTWHIDLHHLLPSAVPEAFGRFYYPGAS